MAACLMILGVDSAPQALLALQACTFNIHTTAVPLARTQNHVPVEVAIFHAMECRTLGRWSRAPCCMTTWAPASRLGPCYCKFLS